MSNYKPVNRRTLASVNQANRQAQDEQSRDPDGKFGSGGGGKVPFGHRSKDPGNENDPMKNVPFGHRSKDPNQDSDLQEPQDPGESNDAKDPNADLPYASTRKPWSAMAPAERAESKFGKHWFIPGRGASNETSGPCEICGENFPSPVHKK